MATRDEIRAATLGASQPIKKEIVEWNGVEIEVREVLEGQREAIIQDSMGEDGAIDTLKWRYNAIIATCFDAKGKPVFDAADIEGFKGQPISGFVRVLEKVVNEILDVTVPGSEGASIDEDSPKNSETAQADN